MNILVLGATGPTGQHIVSQALEQGHDVTAFVRNPEKLSATNGRLHIVTGSVPDNPEAVAQAVRGKDAVISALGVGQTFKPRGLIARSASIIVSAMERQGVRRLIFISAAGVGHTYPLPLLLGLFTRTLLRWLYADKQAGEALIAASQLDWTVVHPVILTHGVKTGRYRVGERVALDGARTISRADVAHFVLTQLGDRTYVRKTPVISY